MKSIQVDGDVYAYLESHGMSAGHSASDVLRQALFHEIDLDDDVFANLMSLASGPDDTINAILRRALGIQASPSNPPPVTSPARIDFHIPAGTGARLWNTRDTAVKGIVGQTLRIYNDNSVAHEPHTNGQPFPHPASAIAPGVFADFVLSSPYDLDTPAPGIYDHAQGAAARFWISVIAA